MQEVETKSNDARPVVEKVTKVTEVKITGVFVGKRTKERPKNAGTKSKLRNIYSAMNSNLSGGSSVSLSAVKNRARTLKAFSNCRAAVERIVNL